MSQKKSYLYLGATALTLAGFAAIGLAPRLHADAGKPAAVAAEAPTLSVVEVQAAPAESGLTLPGTLRAWQDTAIHARAAGYLKRYLVDLGDPVQAGQLLAEIETPDLDQDRIAARAQLAQAEAELALAKSTNDRYQELVRQGAVSKLEADQRATALAAGEASVNNAKAQLGRLNELSGFKRVTAPFAGRITARNAEPGMLVSGSESLFRLADTRQLRVSVQVPQAVAPGVTLGLPAQISLREQPGQLFSGTVSRSAGVLDAARTLTTEIRIDNQDGRLLAGASVDVSLKLPNAQPALLIPANALIVNGKGSQVASVQADSTLKLLPVRLGRDLGKQLEVLEGLSAGARVVLNPPDTLRDGQTVIAQAAKAEPAKPAAKS
jgi:RND family efflux transporter MFP subunit